MQELLFDIAKIDIDRHRARLRYAEFALEIFDAIVQIKADVVLTGLPRMQLGPRPVTAKSCSAQELCQPAGVLIELVIAPALTRRHDAITAGDARRDRLL